MPRRGRRPWSDDDLDALEERIAKIEDGLEDIEDIDQSGAVDQADMELRAILLSLLRDAQKGKTNGPTG